MSRLFTESFEAGHLLRMPGTTSAIATASPMDGLRYLVTPSGTGAGVGFTASDELYFGFFFRRDVGTAAGQAITFWVNGATFLGGLQFDGSGHIQVYTGTSTVVATGTDALVNGTLYHIQVHVKIHDTLGVIEVKLDDILKITFNGDTKPGADTTINGIGYNVLTTGQNSYDTLTINNTSGSVDNSWPGVIRIQRKLVVGAGTYVNNWSRNTGSTNWEAVDEVPPDDDTSYLFTTSANIYESFSMAADALTFVNYKALITSAVAKKDSGTVQLAVGIVDNENAVNYWGANSAVGTSYGVVDSRMTTDPSTSATWTSGGIKAVQALIDSTAG